MLDPGPVAVNWRAQAAGAALAGLSAAALWELIDNGAAGFEWDTYLIRAIALAVLLLAHLAAHLWLARHRGRFIIVLHGYDRDHVDRYRQQLTVAREQGLSDPPPPNFPKALRGYEPTQVDAWLTSVARRT